MHTEKNKIGEILYGLRRKHKVGQEKLYRGLCSKGNYSKYEYGDRIPDRLLLNAFLQRLGKNPDKLAAVLNAEEYQYFCWKKKVLSAVAQEKMKLLRKLLQESQEAAVVVNKNLQQQFLYQMEAIVAEHTFQDNEICIGLLEKAVELTMPGIRSHRMGQYLVSAEEMGILLHLTRFLIKGSREREAERLLREMIRYTEKNYDDPEIKILIYPKAVKLLVPLLLKSRREAEGMALCKKAIRLLCWQGVLYDLAELLEYYLESGRQFPRTPERGRYEKQLWALQEVYREYGAKGYQTEHTFLSYSNRETYLVDEVIKKGRRDKIMSQEILSEGICAPETLSRIESGKRAPNPKNFRALMEKLDTRLDYYNGELDTEDFLLLEKKQELERAISLKNWEEALYLIEYLKTRLDMRRPRNQRTLQTEEKCILFNMGKLDLQEFLRTCEQVMGCEQESWREDGFWDQFFSRYKVRIMNYMACGYYVDGKRENAIFILEHVWKQLVDSKVGMADRYKSGMTILKNLSSFYGELGRVDECCKMCEFGIRLCLEAGRGIRLGDFLGNKAEAENDKAGEDTEKSKKYLEQAYYISDLLSIHRTTAFVECYYYSHYDVVEDWY